MHAIRTPNFLNPAGDDGGLPLHRPSSSTGRTRAHIRARGPGVFAVYRVSTVERVQELKQLPSRAWQCNVLCPFSGRVKRTGEGHVTASGSFGFGEVDGWLGVARIRT